MSGPTIPRIAIAGCWGVPAKYGGFETTAEQLARTIGTDQARLTIYGQRSAYTAEERQGGFAGHERVWMPLTAKGPWSVLHDALHLLHAAFASRHDAILLLGVSGAWVLPLVRLLRPSLRIVTNIDGLEWRRAKFGARTHGLLRWLERRAVRNSHVVVADNAGLQPIVREIHLIEPALIAYGGDHIVLPRHPPPDDGYFLSIARIEPENNPDLILDAALRIGGPLVFVGNWTATPHGRALQQRYAEAAGVDIRQPVYDQERLAQIRGGAKAYVHGHSVGGTNPSLVEALFHCDRILAFDCSFNRATLEGEGAYWQNVDGLVELLRQPGSGRIGSESLQRLRRQYRWRTVAAAYLAALVPTERRSASASA